MGLWQILTFKAEASQIDPEVEHMSPLFSNKGFTSLISLSTSSTKQSSISGCLSDHLASKCHIESVRHSPYQTCTKRHKCVRYLFAMCTFFMTSIFIFASLSIWNGVVSHSYSRLPQRYVNLKHQVEASTIPGRGNINNEKVFIAANIVNEDLIRGSWGDNLVSLVDLLGKENVFVSIYENDGGNATYDALQQLRQRLECDCSVVAGEHISLSDFPATRLPDGQERVRRLTYLAEIRNRLLRPLDPSHQASPSTGFRKADHIRFDRILFLNDVYYSPLEAIQLLFSTNADSGRAEYRAACAIDFVQMFKFYDSFVVRDAEGYQIPLQFFPWFTARGTGISRKDVLSLSDAVRVRSCWGGMAAFDASLFQNQEEKRARVDQFRNETGLSLSFRSNEEPFWEAAECCLIFADMEEQYGKSTGNDADRVFINPYVRTAYSETTWRWIPFWRRFERVFEYFQRLVDLTRPPEWNQRRTHEPGQLVDELVWDQTLDISDPFRNPHYREHRPGHRTGDFKIQRREAEPGGFCGERRMFVMKKDFEAANRNGCGKNWEKIEVPWHRELTRP